MCIYMFEFVWKINGTIHTKLVSTFAFREVNLGNENRTGNKTYF